MIEKIKENGGNLRKLHKYFGIEDTERNIREISLERDQGYGNVFHLKIRSKYCDYNVTDTYINGIPRDMNNVIYSYLNTVRELNYMIHLPRNYPFDEPKWVLKKYSENGKSVHYDGEDPNALYCGRDYSVSMHLDVEILIFVSSLKWFIQE